MTGIVGRGGLLAAVVWCVAVFAGLLRVILRM